MGSALRSLWWVPTGAVYDFADTFTSGLSLHADPGDAVCAWIRITRIRTGYPLQTLFSGDKIGYFTSDTPEELPEIIEMSPDPSL